MSLSNQTEETKKSPVARYYNWSGEKGELYYYDKEAGQKVYVETIDFILIDTKSCVEGFSDKEQTGFRSNEVKSTQKEELVIKFNNNGKVLLRGLYASIKDNIKAAGGNYNISLYGVENIEGEWKIINIKLKGSGLSAWLEFDKSSKVNKVGLTLRIEKSELQKKGAVKYYKPVFIAAPTGSNEHTIAVDLDTELQDYFLNRTAWVTDEPTEEEKSQLRAPGSEKLKNAFKPKEVIEMTADEFLSDDETGDLFDEV